MLNSVDRFLGSCQRNTGRRLLRCLKLLKKLRRDRVKGAPRHLPQFRVGDEGSTKSAGWIEDREVEPDVGEPLIYQLGEHRGRAVERLPGRRTQPDRLIQPAFPPLLLGNGQMPVFGWPRLKTVERLLAVVR